MISTHENLAGREPVTLGTIDNQARDLRKARNEVADQLTVMRDELDAVKRKHMREVKQLVAKAAEKEATLHSSLELAPELFKKPRTLVMHGFKVGYRYNDGKIVFDDLKTTIKLVRRHLPDKADSLIWTEEGINKNGLKTLPEIDLPKIGCRITDRGDQVVVSAVDDDIEKLVGKLIDDMVDVILEQEAA